MRRSTNPPVSNRLTDVEIPRAVWANWIPDDGPRQLRRALTVTERNALEGRRAELEPMLEPFTPAELDHVVLALSDMFGGFTSMRQGDEDAAARLDSVVRLLAPFPAWAIAKACSYIQMNGVYRDGKFDRRWPPNDPEIVKEVRSAMQLYAQQHSQAVAMLSATVEEK